MATNRRNNDSVRFRYGMCLNEKCEKAKSKEIQRLSARKDFVCEECGSPLREVPAPGGNKKKWLFIVGGLAIIAIAVILFIIANNSNKVTEEEVQDPTLIEEPTNLEGVTDSLISTQATTAIDSPAVAEPAPVKEEKAKETEAKPAKNDGKEKSQTTSSATHGTVNLGYGIYTGDLKDGKPHGYGKIKYTKRHKIASSQEYIAEPGDTFEGDFRNGIPSGGTGYWNHGGDMQKITL